MSRSRLTVAVLLTLGVPLVAAQAHAEQAANGGAQTPSAAAPAQRGLELMLRPAFGSASSDSPVRYQASPRVRLAGDPGALLQGAAPYGTGFIGQAFIGYRFHPLISGGLRAGLRKSSASALADSSTNLTRTSWDAGFYVRAYPLALSESLAHSFDPWLAMGVSYQQDMQAFERAVPTSTGSSVNADWTLTHHALAVPLGLGVDYRVLPWLSLGPSFEYTIASGVAGCAKQTATGFASNSYCSNEDPGKLVLQAKTYSVWSLGVDLKVTLF